MHKKYSSKTASSIFLFCVTFAVMAIPVLGQNYPPNDPRGSYYRQAFDQGFRAGQADFQARRASNYNAALVTTAGVAAISRDYRNAFKLGYQDGYAGHNRQSDWYYQHHQHNADCKEEDNRGPENWGCQERHDNGKHKGWYKKHRPKDDDHEDDDRKKDKDSD